MKHFIIQKHISIQKARKDICDDGVTPYKGKTDQISEWAAAFALSKFKINQRVSQKELEKAISEAVIQQTLDSMIQDGLVEAMWDEEKGDVVYRAKK